METETAAVTLLSVLVEREAATPDRLYAVDVAGPRYTYGEAAQATRRWAAAWRGIGVADGDHVVTMQLNSADALFSWLGLAWLGAVEVPVNIDYRGRLLVHALNLSRARVIAVASSYAPRLADVAAELEHVKTVVLLDADEPVALPFEVVTRAELFADVAPAEGLELPSPWDIAVVLFTSGTTGPSKAVRLPWGQLHATATGVLPVEDLGPDDVVFNSGPTFHLGAKSLPYVAALAGGSQVIVPYLSFSELRRVYEDYGVTTAGFVLPPEWVAAPASVDRARLRNVIAPVRVPGGDELKQQLGLRSFGCYSMTEVSVPIRDRGWDQARIDEQGRFSCGQGRTGYPGYELRLVDEHEQPVPVGEVGELVLRTSVPWTMNAGYLNMPEATAEAWRNGWFHTGDAFIADADGHYYFVDRLKDCIRRHGENISSAEVEGHVNEHPGVAASAAVAMRAVDEPGADEEVMVFVVPAEGATVDADELITWLIPRMPRFMVPRYVEFVDSLPVTPTMKVRKAELRERGISPHTWDRVEAGIEVPR